MSRSLASMMFLPSEHSSRTLHFLDESPRPTKRRNSGPSDPLERTPLVQSILGCSLPNQTPMAPRAHDKEAAAWSLALPSDLIKPELFMPSFADDDMMLDMPSSYSLGNTPLPALPLVAASRLRPRALSDTNPCGHGRTSLLACLPDVTLMPDLPDETSNSDDVDELVTAVAKSWPQTGKVVSTPNPKTLTKARSCCALCA